MGSLKYLFLSLFFLPSIAMAQTNLDVAWRVCEGNGHLIGRASNATGPARWVFKPGFSGCEAVQKLVPSQTPQALDPNKAMTDIMLIERGLADPTGKPQ